MFGNAFQERLLHHLSRDRDEADWHVVPRIFFPFWKIGVIFAFFQLSGLFITMPSQKKSRVASKWCYPAPSWPMAASFQLSVTSGPYVSLLHWRYIFLALKLPFGLRGPQSLKATVPCPSSLGCLPHLVVGLCFPYFSCCYRHICRSLSYCTSHLLPYLTPCRLWFSLLLFCLLG